MSNHPIHLKELIEDDQLYYLPCFGSRAPVAFSHGEKAYLFDIEGKRYLDFLGGIAVNSLGHNHPKLTQALQKQVSQLLHCSSLYYIPQQTQLAKVLVENSFADKAFFCNSGAEANEGAIKLARGYYHKKGQPRSTILSALKSFHGRTLATIAATGQPKYSQAFAPLPPDFIHVPYNDISALKANINANTCGVLLELIQGESGVIPADIEYIKEVRKLCDDYHVALIFDEVQTGIGRTGKLFAHEHYGVFPDILTTAKGLGGGIPIGALLANKEFSSGLGLGDHGTTFGGNPLSCTAGLTVLEEILSPFFLDQVTQTGILLQSEIQKLQKHYPLIEEIRGKGLLLGISLSRPLAVTLKNQLLDSGILVGSIGDNCLRLAPPLIITQEDITFFSATLHQVLEKVCLAAK